MSLVLFKMDNRGCKMPLFAFPGVGEDQHDMIGLVGCDGKLFCADCFSR